MNQPDAIVGTRHLTHQLARSVRGIVVNDKHRCIRYKREEIGYQTFQIADFVVRAKSDQRFHELISLPLDIPPALAV